MQLEWKEFVAGFSSAKESYGMLLLFSVLLLAAWGVRRHARAHRLLCTCLLLGVLVFCPLTAVLLLKLYTPFYTWTDLQLLFPTMLLSALFVTEVFFYMKGLSIPGVWAGRYVRTLLAAVLTAVLLLSATTLRVFDRSNTQHQNGVPVQASQIFEALDSAIDTEELLLAAPSELLQYARLYKASWSPLYGRDLWDSRSASYIYSGYEEEYEYFRILDTLWLSEEEYEQVHQWIKEGTLDCMIVPVYWVEKVCPVEGYEAIALADIYVGIIKEDLLIK